MCSPIWQILKTNSDQQGASSYLRQQHLCLQTRQAGRRVPGRQRGQPHAQEGRREVRGGGGHLLWFRMCFRVWRWFRTEGYLILLKVFQERHCRQYLEELVLWSNGLRGRRQMEDFVILWSDMYLVVSQMYYLLIFKHDNIWFQRFWFPIKFNSVLIIVGIVSIKHFSIIWRPWPRSTSLPKTHHHTWYQQK